MSLNGLIGGISSRVMALTARRSGGRTLDLVVEHELPGVTPEMIDWWWDHIDDTRRYALWHPGSHISFTWEVRKEGEHVGRVHRVVERVGPFPVTLRIRWEETGAAGVPLEYGHVNEAAVLGPDGAPLSRLVHQYEEMEKGTRMRSTFRLPEKTPRWFLRGLERHNREEMACFCDFLPGLFAAECGKL